MASRTVLVWAMAILLLLLHFASVVGAAETHTYVFDPCQSTVLERNWSWGYYEAWYYIEGEFQFSVDFNDVVTTAGFDWVDGNLTDEVFYCEDGMQTTESLDVLFHMTDLNCIDGNAASISFLYEKNNPTFPNADVNVIVTFVGDSIHISGRFSEECYDGSQYDLDAVGVLKKYGGGLGDGNYPYLIYDANQMNAIGANPNDWDKDFRLMADIDLGGYTGTQFNLIGKYVGWNDPNNRPFTGVFDGNGHTISNFTYTTVGTYYVGLFEYVYDGKIEDLRLADSNVNVEMVTYTGSLVGFLENGTISGCYAQGGSVSGGGLVGYNDNGIIAKCYSSITVEGGIYTGGLVEENYGGEIYNCCSVGTVSGGNVVGGLVGWNGGIVRDCYSSSDTSGDDEVGGLVGDNDHNSEIIRCYSVGSVSGTSNVGGLVGFNHYVEGVKDSFWDVNTSDCNSSAGGMGMTTAEMQDAGTYLFWGCDSNFVWMIDAGNDYPRLWWEQKPGEVINLGCGTEGDPYLISLPGQMKMIGAGLWHWDKHFRLIADVDLGGIDMNIIGDSSVPFTGVFDGNSHTISNFTYTRIVENEIGIGLFGNVGEAAESNGQVKDLGLIGPDCAVSAVGYVFCVGALVGWLEEGSISSCYVEDGNVSGEDFVGALVGAASSSSTITKCYSSGSVLGDSWVGGLTGGSCMVTQSYSVASVSGNEGVGGLVGQNGNDITHCYSAGSVTGSSNVGGLVGYDDSGVYTKCFWDSDVNPDVNGIGNTTDPNVIGESTANMQTESTYTDAGWDFVGEVINGPNDIWDICEGTNYPKLTWQIPLPGDFICPDGVEMIDFSILGLAWLSSSGQPNWNPVCDISEPNDNFIDELDLKVFTENWLAGL